MRRIVLNMQNYLFCDAIAGVLREEESDFDVHVAESTDEVIDLCGYVRPYAVLMEVTGTSPYLISERLKLRDRIKEKVPDCKIVLVVDENSEKLLAREVRLTKKDGLIDQFIYGSVSATYLVAVLDTL